MTGSIWKPPAGRSRRSPARRSQRPATDGIPEDERELVTEVSDADDADPSWDDDSAARQDTTKRSRPAGAGSDAWWQEQRPPHWG
ncbi:MAG: hypothetical protein WA912_08435 [Ornithinimicrobium sp.]